LFSEFSKTQKIKVKIFARTTALKFGCRSQGRMKTTKPANLNIIPGYQKAFLKIEPKYDFTK